MNERLKHLRKSMGLTQQAFADRIGIKRNTVAKYESGLGGPTTSVMTLICREFGVREAWIRTGEGEMYEERSRAEELKDLCEDIITGNPDFKQRFITALAKLGPDQWAMVESFVNELSEEQRQETAQRQKDKEAESIEAKVEAYRQQLLAEEEEAETSRALQETSRRLA